LLSKKGVVFIRTQEAHNIRASLDGLDGY
jgi:hypothetical protein